MKSINATRNNIIILILTAILSYFSIWIVIAYLLYCFYQYFMTGVEHRAFPVTPHSELMKPLICPSCYKQKSYEVSEEIKTEKILKRTCVSCGHSATYSYSKFVK
ncbi:MAG: hypothetical protein GY714_22870 [Desulfobacterales bacterium]|nr:hypothetical protein [Desulfobacterales bacterium]MCP4162266.1 hypothetical protein [Deltaproteobacteria bacterium]